MDTQKCKTCGRSTEGFKCVDCGSETLEKDEAHECGGGQCQPKCECGEAEENCTCPPVGEPGKKDKNESGSEMETEEPGASKGEESK